jgi:CheY-like chemotaxis protein
MTEKLSLLVLVVDDDQTVLQGIRRDLSFLEPEFIIETASSANEAREILDSLLKSQQLALIFCDHVMPGETGVQFLRSLVASQNPRIPPSAKVLFTGQAGHEDTIEAINSGQIDYYLSKPWDIVNLKKVTRDLLTNYIIRSKISPFPFIKHLDGERIDAYVRENPPTTSE